MAYNGPVWSPRVQDRSGEYAMQGAQALGRGIEQAGGAIGKAIKDVVTKREQTDAVTSRFDALRNDPMAASFITPELEEKFISGSLSSKTGILTETLARMDREQKYQTQAMGYREAGLDRAQRAELAGAELAMRSSMAQEQMKPVLPVKYDTGLGNILINPRTGTPIETPSPADNSGAQVIELPGTAYGVATYNGRPLGGGPIPLKDGNARVPGLQLMPVPNTDMAYVTNEKGERITGSPEFRRKTRLPFEVNTPDRYEPVLPQGVSNKGRITTGPDGTFYQEPGGRVLSLEGESGGQPRWVEIPMPGSGPESTLFPQPAPPAKGAKLKEALDIFNR